MFVHLILILILIVKINGQYDMQLNVTSTTYNDLWSVYGNAFGNGCVNRYAGNVANFIVQNDTGIALLFRTQIAWDAFSMFYDSSGFCQYYMDTFKGEQCCCSVQQRNYLCKYTCSWSGHSINLLMNATPTF